jgi:farnesyl diphosphate synthase
MIKEKFLDIDPDLAQKELALFVANFDEEMLKLLPTAVDVDLSGSENRVLEAMSYALKAGGKRIRPFLILQSALLFDIEPETSLRIAAAVEYVHTYSLIHDDLPAMDDDDLRRGKPSTHKKFDEATAILAGDALLTLYAEVLASPKTHKNPEVRLSLIFALSKSLGLSGMVGGQMLDIEAENRILNKTDIIRMQRMKTGALIEFSCEAGAISANVTDERRDRLKTYAQNIGLAFQVVDDLLDLKGDSKTLGKTAGKDAQAGKATLVSLLGEQGAREFADQLIQDAINALDIFDKKADVLRSLAIFVISRAA